MCLNFWTANYSLSLELYRHAVLFLFSQKKESAEHSHQLLVDKNLNGSNKWGHIVPYSLLCVSHCVPTATETFSSDSALFFYDDLGFSALLVDSNVIMVKVLTSGMNPGGTSEALLVCWQSGSVGRMP